MAEAHQADNKEILQLVQMSGSWSWERKLTQINSKLRNAVYPAHVESFWFVSMLVMAVHFSSRKVPFDMVNAIAFYLPG